MVVKRQRHKSPKEFKRTYLTSPITADNILNLLDIKEKYEILQLELLADTEPIRFEELQPMIKQIQAETLHYKEEFVNLMSKGLLEFMHFSGLADFLDCKSTRTNCLDRVSEASISRMTSTESTKSILEGVLVMYWRRVIWADLPAYTFRSMDITREDTRLGTQIHEVYKYLNQMYTSGKIQMHKEVKKKDGTPNHSQRVYKIDKDYLDEIPDKFKYGGR